MRQQESKPVQRWPYSPSIYHVRCPRCEGRANLDTPFAFTRNDELDSVPQSDAAPRFGEHAAVEKYPSIMKWNEDDWFDRLILKCSYCHLIQARIVMWPDEAYYQWNVRGYTVWAFNREYAEVLRDYIGASIRNEQQYQPWTNTLRKLPREIMSGKVREEVVKKITRTLSSEDERRAS